MKRKKMDLLLLGLVYFSIGLTLLVLFSIIGYVLYKGAPHLKASLFSLTYTSDNVSLFPALISTIIITFFSLLLAVPIGVGASIYLVEYAKKDSLLVKLVSLTTETLSGIPSIVYGLFGLLFFVNFLNMGYSILAGGLTLAIMILPLIMRTTEDALRGVPSGLKEGAFGLGAGKLRTVIWILLPSAIPGILSGVILAIGRIVGETAALIYTAGTVAQIPTSLFSSSRTLSVHMYALSSEGLHTDEAYATAVVILLLVVGINTLSSYIAKKVVKG